MNGEGLRMPWGGAIVCALLLLAIGFVIGDRPEPRPPAIVDAQPLSKETYRVHVSGAVRQPGVYTFTPGMRVEDAVKAAGGALPQARIHELNMAAKLEDELAVVVPGPESASPPQPLKSASKSEEREAKPSEESPAPKTKIAINSASAKELESLPGIGPMLANRIVDYRKKYGNFVNTQELQNVKGIGEALYAKISPHVRL